MKRAIVTLIILLSCLVVQAEHSYLLSYQLDGGKDYHYTANSHIELSYGFKAEPQGNHEVLLDIDTYGVFPPEGGITGGATINNTNGVVGSLGGAVDVSLLGGAVYAIPIDLPTGLGGMRPQLSICYNSQERNGLLGWGWDINGLSSITRTGSTLYHDGQINIGDRFRLDGKRLMKTGLGNYGGHAVDYRTEQDQMSKIVSYQESNFMGPSYFKVWSADGNVLYYGNTNDSKAFVDNKRQVNVWLLNKVEDRDGNTMEFRYTIEKDYYQLDEITYSGNPNDKIEAAFKVSFVYIDRDDVDISFVGNYPYRKRRILSEINVFNGEAEMYSYKFTYKRPKPTEGYPYNLLTEIRLDAGDEHLNPTKIQWGGNNYNSISGSDLKYNVTTNGIPDAFVNAIKFSGDFNGDGFSDVVAVRPNSYGFYSQADIFVNKGVSGNLTFDFVKSINLSTDISWIQVADLDGDGYDDILLSNRIKGFSPFPDHIETEIYLCRMKPSGGFEFVRKYAPICAIPRNIVETHLIGDFFGEGRNIILIQSASNTTGSPEATLLYQYNASTDDFQMISFPEHLATTRFYPADYNGDGITEILYKKDDGSTAIVQLVANNGTYGYNEIFHGTPSDWEDCFPGDFNGDGLIDALFYLPNASQPWAIYLANQNGIHAQSYPLPSNFPYSSPGNYLFTLNQPNHTSQYIKVGDFDGNGCSDLALYQDNYFHVFYGPIRTNSISAPFANTQRISIQAFNLYDNMGVCLGNFLGQERLSFLGPITVSRLPSMALRHEAKTIIDGMGRKTEFAYDYLMPNPNQPSVDDFYHVNSICSNQSLHIHSISVPLRALKETTTYNVSGKATKTRCFYEGALVHSQGKGFLGFSKTRQDDYCNGQLQKRIIKQFDIEYASDVIHLSLSEENVVDHDGNLMARSTYSNRLFNHIRNAKVYVCVVDKSTEEFDVTHPDRLIKKKIHETTVDTHCSQNSKYNDVVSVIGEAEGITDHQDYNIASICEFQASRVTRYHTDDLTNWLINRPKIITNTTHREGNYADICHQKIFSYYSGQPYKVKSIIDIPNDGSHPDDPMVLKTEYQYDRTGNVTVQTISTPNDNQSPRCERFEYDKIYGRRLLTKHVDALKQTCQYTYHPIYNYCTSVTDQNGLVTEYEQDPLGVTVVTYNPDHTLSCSALRWDNESYYLWEKQTGHTTKKTIYALTGDPIQKRSYDINGELVISKIVYDALGRTIKESNPYKVGEEAQFVTYEYDPHNQVSCIRHIDGSYEDIAHDGNESNTTHYSTDGTTQSSSKTCNVMGWVIKSTDADGNSVIYDYRADGKPLWAQIEGHAETRVEMDHDAFGNQTLLVDPNYGTVIYEYNAFNELTRQVSPKLDEIHFTYDALGRLVRRVEIEKKTHNQTTTEWTYETEQGLSGLLTRISSPTQIVNYEYDKLLRPVSTIEQIMGTTYRTDYTYDQASRVSQITYPSGYQVNYHYTSEGLLRCITDDRSHDLWKVTETNASLQPTRFVTGDGYVSEYGYNKTTNRLVSLLTSNGKETIQDLSYDYDDFSNLIERNDLKNSSTEHFDYDCLNRLTHVYSEEGMSEFQYDPLGRMISKRTPNGLVFSNANYTGAKPHAIKSAYAPQGVFPQDRMDIVFNVFDKVEHIAEGTNSVHFDYGFNHQRISSIENINGVARSKVYVNNCEFVTRPTGQNEILTYLSGPSGVFAVVEKVNAQENLHYIHKDHLGSWTVITGSDGRVEQENHFDAWGNCANADNLMFDRGFTGHEHIRGMGLINMNGRLYDPTTSSMISPDNNIQMPDLTQNLNRYAYCLNNPLTYTDPDGNTAFEAILMFYVLYCTDMGYEFQKFNQALAVHLDLHLSSQQLGVGMDVSFGVPKKLGISYRAHMGATYYWRFYDNSYSGFEFRVGAEWCVAGFVGFSGTKFCYGGATQTTNVITLGNYRGNLRYENDYMFNLAKYFPLVPAADGGDRYRSAAAKIRLGLFSMGVNLFTGNPGVDHDIRRTFDDPDANGRATYTISANGDNPDEFRAGVFYVGFGPFKVGGNSEQIRNVFQNKFAHDFLCRGDSPYFKVLDRPGQFYFYFGTETGNTLW